MPGFTNLKLLTVGLLSLAARSAEGQTYSWLRSYGGSGYDDTNAVATDSSGNSYITGTFTSDWVTMNTYGLSKDVLTYKTGDIFVAKLSKTGIVTWAVQYVSLVDLVRYG
jgi:hypothetical protein